MVYLETLIDRAADLCGSDAELARRIGVDRAAIAMMRRRKRLSPEVAALLAALVHDDPHHATECALIENAKPRMADLLRRAFHAGLAAGVAVMLPHYDAVAAGLNPPAANSSLSEYTLWIARRLAHMAWQKLAGPLAQAARRYGDAIPGQLGGAAAVQG